MHSGFCWGNLGKRPLEDPGVNGRIILRLNLGSRIGGGGGEMDWIDLAGDRDRWRALESAVMNIRVP